MYIYKYIYKLATIVKSDPKCPVPIATTPGRREGHNSFPWIVTYHIMLGVMQGSHQVPFFLSLV